jgi:dimethylamine monooxygenase subunit A
MTPILQKSLPFAPWMDPRTWRLPGIVPLPDDSWIAPDDAYAGQMAERDRLIRDTPEAVHALLPEGRDAAAELYARVMTKLAGMPGFCIAADRVTRPDGVTVPLDPEAPLLTLGRLVQEDLCLMQGQGAEHVLTGAILCFPASWTLAQKIGRPLVGIHEPVEGYAGDLARRVQRLFDAIRPEQPLMRFNALVYDDPTLHQPRAEHVARPRPVQRLYLRSERQCLLRLPQTGAVLFSIHTVIVRTQDLAPEVRVALDASLLDAD